MSLTISVIYSRFSKHTSLVLSADKVEFLKEDRLNLLEMNRFPNTDDMSARIAPLALESFGPSVEE